MSRLEYSQTYCTPLSTNKPRGHRTTYGRYLWTPLPSHVYRTFFCCSDVLLPKWANSMMETSRKKKTELSPKNSGWGPYSDLVKLGKELKNMADALMEASVSHPKVCGLLDEGERCKMFLLELKCEAVYVMTELNAFRLVTDIRDLVLLPSIISCLMQLKRIIMTTATALKNVDSKYTASTTSWLRPSFGTPIKV
ncbi:hypothetical protein VTP01DRAFT_477 [Rhizomucor pusillus]|uniref:uncharacterized protein n=1 Tax=Rhizomucor pusillus TaxID=4840 RepID=UPI003743AC38